MSVASSAIDNTQKLLLVNRWCNKINEYDSHGILRDCGMAFLSAVSVYM